MSLISGKEALIALANGEEVEGSIGSKWVDISVDQKLSIRSFITETNDYGDAVQFRIKPQAITINGIEVPAPFKPKSGDEVYFIDCDTHRGYSSDVYGESCEEQWVQFGAWRTEEEIKQVVEVLQQIFK